MRPSLPGKPPAFVHVDLDGLWTLAGAYGFPQGRLFEHDPVFEFGVARLLDLFDEIGFKATIFIVGRDLESSGKRELAQRIVECGHELGNHSYSHPIGIERLSDAELRREVRHAQSLISELTGFTPYAFRAPGYDCGPRTLAALQDAGIRVDGSRLPTRWAPPLRWMARRLRDKVARTLPPPPPPNAPSGPTPRELPEGLQDLDDELPAVPAPVDPARLAGQYGEGSGGLMGLAPQCARPNPHGPAILRLPLAVSPVLRLPLHASLGMFMGEESVKTGLRRLALEGWPITYLLHGLDVVAPEEFIDLLPAPLRGSAFMKPLPEKMRFLRGVLRELKRVTRLELTSDYLIRAGEPGPAHHSYAESRIRGLDDD